MKKLLAALSLLCLSAHPSLAEVSDYLGPNARSSSGCPKAIVIRPEISGKNVSYPIQSADLETASKMIGAAVATGVEGASVIAARDLESYRSCKVPVVLARLKSYTKEPAVLGQSRGKLEVSILRFSSQSSDAPDKTVEVSATGGPHWGDTVPFMNAVQALCDKIWQSPW